MTLNMNPHIRHVNMDSHCVGAGGSILLKDFRCNLLKVCNLPVITKYIRFSVKIVFDNVS